MSSGAGSLRRAGVGAVVVATAAIAAPAFAGADQPKPQAVTCEVHAGARELAIRLRDIREHVNLLEGLDVSDLPRDIRHQIRRQRHRVFKASPVLAIERRIDEITVLDQTKDPGFVDVYGPPSEGAVRSCGQPLVGTTDRVSIATGRHTHEADLHLDLQYGLLAPGPTDEGDGSSEIELDARLGTGTATVGMTRGADFVTVERPHSAARPHPTAINLDAAEGNPDADLVVGHRSPVIVVGRGGDDQLSTSGGVTARDLDTEGFTSALLFGGQGNDKLTGGDGSDGLIDGPGRDRIDAGGGLDQVLALGGAPDRIDCGPGFDLALVRSKDSHVRHCEKVLDPHEFPLRGPELDELLSD